MPHDAFILAAGFGTRLRPLTLVRPKPLVPVCGVPMLSYALAACARHGLRDVIVNAHHLAEQLTAWQGEREGVAVTVTVEAEIAGTGGGLRRVADRLAERFVVVNADVLADLDLTALRAAVPDGGAAMALRRSAEDAPRYGVVAADAVGVVVELTTVARDDGAVPVARDTHFTGLHAMDRATLALIPASGEACVVRTAYRALVPQRKVRAVVHPGTWLDVGDCAAYLAANLTALTTLTPLSLDPFARAAFAVGPRGVVGAPGPGVEVRGAAWVGPGARVGRGAVLTDSVVGAGAVVSAGARLTRCVVWDGVEVPPGEHTDAVLYGAGVWSA